MSEIGQQLCFYDELYERAELIDNVLTRIKENNLNDGKSYISELGEMLVSMAERNWQNSSARLFVILQQDFSQSKRNELSKIGQNLLTQNFNDETVSSLEALARILEDEQTNVMARVKGL